MDEDALARPDVGHLEQHHVGGHVVDGDGGSLLEAHLLGHGEGVAGGQDHHFLPQAAATQHDDSVAHLEEIQSVRLDKKLLKKLYFLCGIQPQR